MPNNQPPSKTRIDPLAKQAIADIDKLLETPQGRDLKLQLTKVKTSLETIKNDPHKAQ
jgi:hypothetical protein